MTEYVFAHNINNSGQSGIIDLNSKKIICFCTEENSKLLLEALEIYKKKSPITVWPIKCPKCGEKENLHPNIDYSKNFIESVLCNECGYIYGNIE